MDDNIHKKPFSFILLEKYGKQKVGKGKNKKKTKNNMTNKSRNM